MANTDAERTKRVGKILSSKHIAVVGASEKSPWTRFILNSAKTFDFDGSLHMVNRDGSDVFGQHAVTSCRDIDQEIDVAALLVPTRAVPDAMRDLAASSIHEAVILAGDFKESGKEGSERQDEVMALAHEHDILFLGPNCIGFANILGRSSAWVGVSPGVVLHGSVAIVSQSGAMACAISDFAGAQRIGISHMVSTGNQAMIDVTDVIDSLASDESVRVFAVFAEEIREPRRFLSVAHKVLGLGKAIVMLKAGSSSIGAATVLSHTGALAGDDAIVSAGLAGAGVIRVNSIEELVITAGLIAHTGVLPAGGLGVMAGSGGVIDIAADRAEALGIALPTLGADEDHKLGGQIQLTNPLDLTGFVYSNREMIPDALAVFAAEPSIAATVYVHSFLPRPERTGDLARLGQVGKGLSAMAGRGVLVGSTVRDISAPMMDMLDECEIPYTLGGLEDALQALGHDFWWSSRVRRIEASSQVQRVDHVRPVTVEHGQWTEADALALLAENGVPTVPFAVATTSDEAKACACEIGFPVAVKVLSSQIAHKSDIGGVELGVDNEDDVAAAFTRVTQAGSLVKGAKVEGVVISAMRHDVIELLVGITRDEQWGLVLTVALGGIFVEVFQDKAIRILPVQRSDIVEMLDELRGASLFQSSRGKVSAAGIDRLVDVIEHVVQLGENLGDSIEAIEINPVALGGNVAEALDALFVWSD